MLTNQNSKNVANAKPNGGSISRRMYMSRIGKRQRDDGDDEFTNISLPTPDAAVTELLRRGRGDNARDVRPRFGKGRNPVRGIDRARPGVIRRDREFHVSLIAPEQVVQIRTSAGD